MISVLSIDNDTEFTRLLDIYLQSEGGMVLSIAPDSATGYQLLAEQGFDVLLLETRLPETSGFEVLRSLRRSGDDIPVIMFTSRGDNMARYSILEHWPDLFLPKSSRFPELVQNILCLHAAHEDAAMNFNSRRLSLQQLELDASRLGARYQGRTLDLNIAEFAILEHLALRPGQGRDMESIAGAARRRGLDLDPASLQRTISRLRKKMGPGSDGRHTLRLEPDQTYSLRV